MQEICHFFARSGEELEVGGAADGDGKGTDVWEGNDQVAVVVDALDGALDAGEGAMEEADTLAFTTEVVGIGVVGAQTFVVVDGQGADELLHLVLGDGDDHRRLVVGAGLDGHELHVDAVAVEHLQLAQLGPVGIDEDEIVDDGLLAMDKLLAYTLGDVLHGEEIADALLVEGFVDNFLTAVGDVHGVPGHL